MGRSLSKLPPVWCMRKELQPLRQVTASPWADRARLSSAAVVKRRSPALVVCRRWTPTRAGPRPALWPTASSAPPSPPGSPQACSGPRSRGQQSPWLRSLWFRFLLGAGEWPAADRRTAMLSGAPDSTRYSTLTWMAEQRWKWERAGTS